MFADRRECLFCENKNKIECLSVFADVKECSCVSMFVVAGVREIQRMRERLTREPAGMRVDIDREIRRELEEERLREQFTSSVSKR